MTPDSSPYQVDLLREDFPILRRRFYGKQLVYLDNTATSQTPKCVVEAIERAYFNTKANVHRGVFTIAQEATELLELSRKRVAELIGTDDPAQIIFTRGTTEAINLVASSFGSLLNDGDEIILTQMEHHANIVPWQLLASRKRITLKVVPLNPDGSLRLEALNELFSPRTRLVSLCHVSNVLGTVNPVAEVIAMAHSRGVPVMIDGAQAVSHTRVNVAELDADFYAFSSHKMYGPSGIGVLYAKRKWLEAMPPYQGGGEMIDHVSFEHTTFADIPYKFEAGTPDFVGIAALHTAIDYIERVGIDKIAAHEHQLLQYTTERMNEIEGMTIYGTTPGKAPIISFNVEGIHHYDLGMLLDKMAVAVRTGHHCAQPLMTSLGIEGCVRASFALYNTLEECDAFIAALHKVIPMLR